MLKIFFTFIFKIISCSNKCQDFSLLGLTKQYIVTHIKGNKTALFKQNSLLSQLKTNKQKYELKILLTIHLINSIRIYTVTFLLKNVYNFIQNYIMLQ